MTVVEVQTCSNLNAAEAPELLSISLFIYCIHIHNTHVWVCIYIYIHTHTGTYIYILKNLLRASKTEILHIYQKAR